MVSPTILEHCGLWKAMEHSRHGGDVMACLSEARKGFIVGDDPSVYIVGYGACSPTVSVAFDLPIDLRVFPHKLESGFIDLPLLGS